MASRALVASLWNFAGNWGQQLASVIIFLYLVRTLDAADFGLMALAAAFIDIMTAFGRFGQVEALLQRRFVSQRVASTSFWLLVGIGTTSLLLFVAAAPVFSEVFDDERVGLIVLILAPVPLIFNITQVHEYFLRVDFQYKSIAIRNVLATLLSGTTAVAAAYFGYGFYALVIQKLVFTIVYALSLAIAYRWRPSVVFSRPAAAKLSGSGFDVVIANIIAMLNPRIVDIFVGYFLGVAALGYLRIAWRLFDLMIQCIFLPIVSVSISSLTACKGNLEKLRASFMTYLSVLTLFAMPIFIETALIAEDIVRLAAGERWADAVIYLKLLCISALLLPVSFLFSPLMIGLERTRTIRDQALFQIIVTAVTMFFAAQTTLVVVLLSHIARVYLFAGVNLILIRRYAGIGLTDVLKGAVPALAATATMAAVVILVQSHFGIEQRSIPHTAALVVIGSAAYVVVLFAGEKIGLWPGYSRQAVQLVQKILKR